MAHKQHTKFANAIEAESCKIVHCTKATSRHYAGKLEEMPAISDKMFTNIAR